MVVLIIHKVATAFITIPMKQLSVKINNLRNRSQWGGRAAPHLMMISNQKSPSSGIESF